MLNTKNFYKVILSLVVIAIASVANLSFTEEASAAGDIIINGGFETAVGSEWTLSNVDVVSGWDAHGGSVLVDLNAFLPGSISQTLSTFPGRTYGVSFWLSGNPQCGINTKTASVTAPGFSQSYTATAGPSELNLNWTQYTFSFTATGYSSALTFTGVGTNDACGALVDDVSVTDPGPDSIGRTPWQMFHLNERVNGIGPFPTHGHPGNYAHVGPIPAVDAVDTTLPGIGWIPAPDGNVVGFNRVSRLGGAYGCRTSLDYTFFQTLVDIPVGTTLGSFTIFFSGMDDGSQVTLFNTANPNGVVIPGSTVQLGGSLTLDMKPFVAIGETNRVVITQIDDCAVGNNLSVAQINLNGAVVSPNEPPTAEAGGPYSVPESSSVVLSAAGSTDSDDGIVSYDWDLDGNGGYETSGVTPTFSAAGLDGPSSVTVGLRVCDATGECDEDTAVVNVTNVFPNFDQTFSYSGDEGTTIPISVSATDVAGALDPLTYSWDLDGNASFETPGQTINFPLVDGDDYITVRARVDDGDGGFRLTTVGINVNNLPPTADAGGPYEALDGLPITLDGDGDDPAGSDDPLTFSWDLDNNGSFETLGQNPSLDPNSYVGSGPHTITLRVEDGDGGVATSSTTVTTNSPPVVEIDDSTDVYYVDWTSASPSGGTASGVINLPNGDTIGVSFTSKDSSGNPAPYLGAQTSGGTAFWATDAPYLSAQVPTGPNSLPAPNNSDLLQLSGGSASTTYTVTFTEPIVGPIMPILSLGQGGIQVRYDFDSPFTIVSQGVGHFGGCATCLSELPGDILAGNEGHGTIVFDGTYSTFSWVVPTNEFWHGFTFGVRTSASLGDAVVVDEGETAVNSGTFSDPDLGDIVTLTLDGDGILSPLSGAGGAWSWSFATTDGPADDQTITITGTDSHGLTDTASFDLVVNNVAPTAIAGGPYSVNEGSSVGLTGSGTDVAADLPLTFEWDLDNDGFYDDANTQNTTFDAALLGGPGVHTVGLQVDDGDGGVTTTTAIVTVNNVAPVVDAGGDATVDEGSTFSRSGSFTDPGADTWTATVNYGDGGGDESLTLTGKNFALSNLYADNGTYTVTVTVDDGDATDTDTFTVTVDNVDPEVSAGPDATINEGDTFIGSGSFTDPGADEWTATVDYGDGDGVEPLALDGNDFDLSHTYAEDGTYTVTVTVEDDDLGVGSDTVTVTVNNVAPVVTLTGDAVLENGFATVSGTFTDVGILDTHSVEVDWGGSEGTSPATVDQLAGTFTASHQYLDDDPSGTSLDVYSITASATDDDGGVGTASASVEVTNVAPVITSLTGNDNNGSVTVNFTDIGSNDTHNVSIDWGDGEATTILGAVGSATAGHLFPQFGTYTVTVTVTDDDTGSATNTVDLIIGGGACACTEGLGWWKKQYDPKQIAKGNTVLTDHQIDLLAQMVGAQSAVFAGITVPGANDVFDPPKAPKNGSKSGGSKSARNDASATGSSKSKGKKKGSKAGSGSNNEESESSATDLTKFEQNAEKHLLVAWLNYAKGAINMDDVVDTNGNKSGGEMTLSQILTEVESILADPAATKSDLNRVKDLAESVAKFSKGDPDCETGTGSSKSGSGSGSKSGSGSDSGSGTGSGEAKGKKK